VSCRPYAPRSSRLHCVAAGGNGVVAVHVDGRLRAVLSGAVLAGAATPVGKSAHAVQFDFRFNEKENDTSTSQQLDTKIWHTEFVIQTKMASWSIQAFGQSRHGPKIERGSAPFLGRAKLGPYLTQSRMG